MNGQEQEQVSQGLNICLFNAFAKACNAAEAVEKIGEEAYSATVTGIAAFVQYDKLAFAARAAAVALAGIITKEVAHYSYLSRPRVAVALSRLQDATAIASAAAKRAGKEVAPTTGYPHDVTAAQILDTVELTWSTINILDASRADSGPVRAEFMAFQRLITLNFTFGYNSPYIPGELAESFVTAMKRVSTTIKVLHEDAQQALRRVQDAR